MDLGHTRDFSEFCEQLNEVRTKFQKWDGCEKTVAIYYLMVGLPFANARFLQNALEQLVMSIKTPEAEILENNANDPKVISSFMTENPQSTLYNLLNHLPLLKPGNREGAQSYLNTIRRIITEFIAPPFKKIYNECVEIMSYVYIHPAFDKEDKKSFKHLLKQVLNKVSPETFIHSTTTESSDESTSPNPDFYANNKKRSKSLTPGTTYLFDVENWSSQENLTQPSLKPRSYSLSHDKSYIDMTNIHGSSSETKLQELLIRNNQPLMKSILSWLKSLRLHKYSWIFQNLTSSQMLSINEEYLTSAGVTKGARHKLLLSLQKLKERGKLLSELEITIMNGGDINDALKELKAVLQSPLQISVGEDLCSQFVKVMGKVCTQLLMLRQPTDENLVLFNALCEKAANLDTFTVEHKRKLNMWKDQLSAANVLLSCSERICRKNIRDNHIASPIPNQFDRSADLTSNAHKSSSYPNMLTSPNLTSHRHSVDSVTLKNQLFYVNAKEPSSGVFGVNSYKLDSNFNNTTCNNHTQDLDIESSLESLCIQMMEHALGP